MAKAESYEELLAVADLYVTGKQSEAADAVGRLNGDDFTGNAKGLYDDLMGAVSSALFSQYYTAGTTAYVAGDYSTAAQQLQLAVDSDPERTNSQYADALMYLGFAYYNMGDTANADETFRKFMDDYPSRAYEVQYYISDNSGENGGQSGVSQGEASMQGGDNSGQEITVYGDSNTGLGYDPSQVAWTDPYTGLNYDVDGNLLG